MLKLQAKMQKKLLTIYFSANDDLFLEVPKTLMDSGYLINPAQSVCMGES